MYRQCGQGMNDRSKAPNSPDYRCNDERKEDAEAQMLAVTIGLALLALTLVVRRWRTRLTIFDTIAS
jgi:hypothetical protein